MVRTTRALYLIDLTNFTIVVIAVPTLAKSTLQHYASYLDARIKAHANLRHDAVRVQNESNRDHIADVGGSSNGRINRSKTVAGRKLRVMTVEKGLLRETKIIQKMIASLLECKV